ncbi:hypothetical protein CHS0354_012699 [Potamilus streckersoni]|uniref:Uncharacterized protein n=1 Tax=Potamilus streckersoni TaxID=2493646 RepID=A0AAE0SXS0_9BIVA|nr:hypothetical protein CHS0354_012699 [Potamilus streckersoni]
MCKSIEGPKDTFVEFYYEEGEEDKKTKQDVVTAADNESDDRENIMRVQLVATFTENIMRVQLVAIFTENNMRVQLVATFTENIMRVHLVATFTDRRLPSNTRK